MQAGKKIQLEGKGIMTRKPRTI